MPPRHTRIDATAATAMVVLCAIWGLNQVAAKVVNAGISPVLQAGLRSAGAALLVWAWSSWRGVRLCDRDGTLGPGLLAGLFFAVEFALIYRGLEFTTASRAVVFLYTSPFWVALGVHLLVPGEHLQRNQIAGLITAFAGVVIAVGDGLTFPTWAQLIGDAMLLGAGLLWGATTVVVKASRLAGVSANKTLLYQLGVSGALLPIASLLLAEPGIFAPTPFIWATLAFQTVIVAFITYLVWFWLVANYPAGRLSAFTFLTPLFGLVAGVVLLDEPLTAGLVLAMTLVGTGISLVNRSSARP